MKHQVVHTKQDRALNLFTKRGNRFHEDEFIRGGQINQIVGMNQDRRQLRGAFRSPKYFNALACQRLGHPSARVPREKLHGIASGFFRDDERLVQAVLDGRMKTDARPAIDSLPCHRRSELSRCMTKIEKFVAAAAGL